MTPKRLYKYSPINQYSLKNLKNNQLFFSHPWRFNDPFDTKHKISTSTLSSEHLSKLFARFIQDGIRALQFEQLLDKTISRNEFLSFCNFYFTQLVPSSPDLDVKRTMFLKELTDQVKISQELFKENLNGISTVITSSIQNMLASSMTVVREEMFNKVGVCCFSENHDNLLLWSYYSEGHNGVCLEFDTSKEPFTKVKKVNYVEDAPIINLDEVYSDNDSTESIEKFLCQKAKAWSHEEEWRILHKSSDLLFTYGSNVITGVYFGVNTDKTQREIICTILKNQHRQINFFQMTKHPERFELIATQFDYLPHLQAQNHIMLTIIVNFQLKLWTLPELHELLKSALSLLELKSHIELLVESNMVIQKDNQFRIIM